MNDQIKWIRLDPDLPVSPVFNDEIMNHLASHGLVNDQSKQFQIYTLYHKQAFMALTFDFYEVIVTPEILHDTDKLVLYGLIDYKNASGLHKDFSSHHYGSLAKEFYVEEAIIDYECARFTKPDKPLNAYETVMRLRPPESHDLFKSAMEPLGICGPEHLVFGFKKWKERIQLPHFVEMLVDSNCRSIDKLIENINKDGFAHALTEFNRFY